MDQLVVDIFSRATDVQQDYVGARLIHQNNAQAARSLGIHRSTPDKWPNRGELEEAISLLRLDKIAAVEIALKNELLEAVAALHRAIRDNGAHSVQAARAILDRAGFPAQSSVDVTSGGEPIRATIYIPANGREDDD